MGMSFVVDLSSLRREGQFWAPASEFNPFQETGLQAKDRSLVKCREFGVFERLLVCVRNPSVSDGS